MTTPRRSSRFTGVDPSPRPNTRSQSHSIQASARPGDGPIQSRLPETQVKRSNAYGSSGKPVMAGRRKFNAGTGFAQSFDLAVQEAAEQQEEAETGGPQADQQDAPEAESATKQDEAAAASSQGSTKRKRQPARSRKPTRKAPSVEVVLEESEESEGPEDAEEDAPEAEPAVEPETESEDELEEELEKEQLVAAQVDPTQGITTVLDQTYGTHRAMERPNYGEPPTPTTPDRARVAIQAFLRSYWALLLLALPIVMLVSTYYDSLVTTSTSVARSAFSVVPTTLGFFGSMIHGIGHRATLRPKSSADSLKSRLELIESELLKLRETPGLLPETEQLLYRILPERIVFRQNPLTGEPEFSDALWLGLKEKMRVDPEFQAEFNHTWGEWRQENEDKLSALFRLAHGHEVDGPASAYMANQDFISKKAFIQYFGQRFTNLSDHVSTMWRDRDKLINQKVDYLMDKLPSVAEQAALDALSRQNWDKSSPKAQAHAQVFSVAESHLVRHWLSAMHHVNFFSGKLGARVIPRLTSPAFKPRSRGLLASLFTRAFQLYRFNPPEEALRSWSEAGDCWCSPVSPMTFAERDQILANPERYRNYTSLKKEDVGKGAAQLGILMPHKVYPQRLVIEHVPHGGTLDISTAIREFELWVETTSTEDRATVIHNRLLLRNYPHERDDLLGGPSTPHIGLPPNFVRLGRWQYNIHDDNFAQSGIIDIDMKALKVAVQTAVVRVVNNWGQLHTCVYRIRLLGEPAEDIGGEMGKKVAM